MTESRRLTPPPPNRPHPTVVLAVIGTGTLLSAMSNSTVALALPKIGNDLHAPLNAASWVMLAALLTTTVLLMPAGRLSDVWGHRRMYLTGFLVFGLASLACGLADSLGMLVASRVVQSIGGAMVMASGPALLTTSFLTTQRGRALGALSTMTYVGLTIGPPLGGWVMALASWRWIFLINLPVMVVIVALGWFFLPTTVKRPARAVDVAGFLTFLLGMPLLLLALTQGERWGWFAPSTLIAAVAGLAFLAGFVLVERRHTDPMLDLTLFRSKVFTGAALSALGNYISIFIVTILLPFCLMEGLAISSPDAGLLLSAQPLLMAIVASPSGWLSDRIGTRGLAIAGLVILAGGVAGLSTTSPATSHYTIALWLATVGLGTGIFISPNSSALMGSAPENRQGVAAGVMALARSTGMMIGVAGSAALFQAAGGATGRPWLPTDFAAQRHTYWISVAVCLLAALASVWAKVDAAD